MQVVGTFGEQTNQSRKTFGLWEIPFCWQPQNKLSKLTFVSPSIKQNLKILHLKRKIKFWEDEISYELKVIILYHFFTI